MSDILPILCGVTHEKKEVFFQPKMLNRHGLIAGATGTGKTVTLQVLAEALSKIGTSVFLTDIKGDLSGLSQAIVPGESIKKRLANFDNFQLIPSACPVNFMDVFGKFGHPIRVTPSSMGPLLLSRLLELNDTQEGVLHVAFRYADDQGLLLLDLKDLQAVLVCMAEHIAEIKTTHGNVSPASIGAIQRRLLVLEEQGADQFFGEPEFDISDLLLRDFSGRGLVNILDATELLQRPRVYAAMLLYLLSELYEHLDEVGDRDAPRLALFFDEAHLLFDDLPKVLLEKIEMVVRLIRSKGVCVFFITQNTSDLPESILSQLGNRIQHAIRSYTPKDAEMVRKTARTFRARPDTNVEAILTDLKLGEALVSPLSESGEPSEVERVLVRPPSSQIGPISSEQRKEFISRSPFSNKYSATIDRESAYEVLQERAKEEARLAKELEAKAAAEKARQKEEKTTSKRQGPFEAFFVSMARSVGRSLGTKILRGVLGTMTKK